MLPPVRYHGTYLSLHRRLPLQPDAARPFRTVTWSLNTQTCRCTPGIGTVTHLAEPCQGRTAVLTEGSDDTPEVGLYNINEGRVDVVGQPPGAHRGDRHQCHLPYLQRSRTSTHSSSSHSL